MRSRKANARSPWTRGHCRRLSGPSAEAYTQLGQFENGLEFTDKAIRLSPHDSGLIYWYADKASDYIGLGQYDQAIEWARRAVAVNPNDPSAHYVLGLAYAFLGQDDKALEEFDKAIQLTPQGSSVNAYYREKANVYFGLKQYDEAIAWARRTIALDGGDWGAQAVLIAALALTGQNAEAQEALQRYLALPSADPGQSRSSRRPALNTKNRIAVRALTIFSRGERKACARRECRRSEMAGSGRCAGLMTTFPTGPSNRDRRMIDSRRFATFNCSRHRAERKRSEFAS